LLTPPRCHASAPCAGPGAGRATPRFHVCIYMHASQTVYFLHSLPGPLSHWRPRIFDPRALAPSRPRLPAAASPRGGGACGLAGQGRLALLRHASPPMHPAGTPSSRHPPLCAPAAVLEGARRCTAAAARGILSGRAPIPPGTPPNERPPRTLNTLHLASPSLPRAAAARLYSLRSGGAPPPPRAGPGKHTRPRRRARAPAPRRAAPRGAALCQTTQPAPPRGSPRQIFLGPPPCPPKQRGRPPPQCSPRHWAASPRIRGSQSPGRRRRNRRRSRLAGLRPSCPPPISGWPPPRRARRPRPRPPG
jgi:hypothetical protein